MTPAEQVKTIMEIFIDIPHNEQVDLFKEIKAQLIDHRKSQMEVLQKNITITTENVEVLHKGNCEITGMVQ